MVWLWVWLWLWMIQRGRFVGAVYRARNDTNVEKKTDWFVSKHNNDVPGGDSTTKKVLDAISRQHTFYQGFPAKVWRRIYDCWQQESTPEINLQNVSDAAWQGFLEYAQSNGTPTDVWGSDKGWIEENPTPLDDSVPGGSSILVFEPCNTVSNLAYYRTMFAMCDRINQKSTKGDFDKIKNKPPWSISDDAVRASVQILNTLAFGSAFFHASQTSLAGLFDILPIDLFSWTAYQAAIGSLSYDPFLFDLQETPRNFTAIDVAAELSKVFLEEETVLNWRNAVRERGIDPPNFFLTFSALGQTVLNLVLPEILANPISDFLVGLLVETVNLQQLVREKVRPAIKLALQDVEIGFVSGTKLLASFTGIIVKALYSFLWQESIISIPEIIQANPFVNTVGYALVPVFTAIGNLLTGYDRSNDIALQTSFKVYPGSFLCNKKIPHCKWHEMSANFLVDVMFGADDINRVVSGQTILFREYDSEALQCLVEHDCFDDFDLDAIEDSAADPAVASLAECLPSVLDTWPGGSFSDFANCLLSSLREKVGSSTELELLEPGTSTDSTDGGLGTCLLRNKCFHFNDNEGVDRLRIIECLDIESNVCSSWVQEEALSGLIECLGDFSKGMMDEVGCFHKHSTLEPQVTALGSCLGSLIMSPNDPDYEYLLAICQKSRDEIVGDSFGRPSTILEGVSRGLPRMAMCAATTCQTSYSEANSMRNSVWGCTEDCFVGKVQLVPLPFLELPSRMLCAIECYSGLLMLEGV